MKRKKVECINSIKIWDDRLIKIEKEDDGNYYFEVNGEITTDVSEAVSILMRVKSKWNDPIWNLNTYDFDIYNIKPAKTLYWLTGGDDEWGKENYKKNWAESFHIFEDEYNETIINIIRKSKTLKDIRDGFLKKLNLPKLYEFALRNGIA